MSSSDSSRYDRASNLVDDSSAGSKGAVTAQVTLALPIDPDMPKGTVKYNIVADIANFSVDPEPDPPEHPATAVATTSSPTPRPSFSVRILAVESPE